MNAAERFATDKAFKAFHAEGELAQRERAFRAYRTFAESVEMFVGRILRAVDDSQVFPTATLQGWLNETVLPLADEVQRFDDHAFRRTFFAANDVRLVPFRDP